MNLTQVLNQALPELPRIQPKHKYPKLHPDIIAREHLKEGVPTITAMVPGKSKLIYFTRDQWDLVRLFDGQRSPREIAALVRANKNWKLREKDVQAFADALDTRGFWYKTPQEENIALMHQLAQNRNKKIKETAVSAKSGDMSQIDLVYWNPDTFFTWLHEKVRWVYTPWFTALTLVLFAVMIAIFIQGWDEIWADSLQYYNFREKGFRDFLEFYMLFAVLAVLHESAHGLTGKHFGAGIPRMGALLIYLSPAVFVDLTQVWVYGTKWQRIMSMLAGLWVELILCAVMTIVWWGTPVGSPAHDLAYKFMLIGGIFVVIINMNPLMKMDGYHIFSEIVGISMLKETSTQFVSSWVKKHIFRLPVTVEYFPLRRRIFFACYGVLSGAYSYLVLLFLARLTYRIFYNYTPEWAFLPATLVALRILRSRIAKLREFLKTLYLDKKEIMLAHRKLLIAGAVALLIVGVLPLRRQTIETRFILEPISRAVVRAEVPGAVVQVLADEGQKVAAGSPIVRLRDLQLESEAARAAADYKTATAAATQAQLRYAGFAAASGQRQQLAERVRTLADRQQHLEIAAPISGVVVTPEPQRLAGAYVTAGTELLQLADTSRMRARVYIPEAEVYKAETISGTSLRPDGLVGTFHGQFTYLAPSPRPIETGLIPATKFKGLQPPPFYVATVVVENPDGRLRDGMAGDAKVFGKRESVLGAVWQNAAEFVSRKVW